MSGHYLEDACQHRLATIRVTKTTRGSPDPNGIATYLYRAGEVYGQATDPPMPAGLMAVFLREGWGERCDGVDEQVVPQVVAPPIKLEPIEPNSACLWCGAAYARRVSGGKAQRFHSQDCRAAFHRACRRWAMAEVDAGRVSVATIRKFL